MNPLSLASITVGVGLIHSEEVCLQFLQRKSVNRKVRVLVLGVLLMVTLFTVYPMILFATPHQREGIMLIGPSLHSPSPGLVQWDRMTD